MRRAVGVLAATVVAAVLLAVGSGVAGAATESQSHTDSLATLTTNWNRQFTIPKFNTDLGRLDSVRIEYSATVEGNADFENLDEDATAKVTTTMSAKVALSLPGAVTPLSELAPTKTVMDDLETFDGINDSDGASGRTYALLTATVTFDQTFSTDDVLSLFRGTVGQTVALPVAATGQSTIVTDGGSLDSFVRTRASGAIKVTYTYTPPSVDIEKLTNGVDADTPTGPYVGVDGAVTWTYVVTNTGGMPLTEIVVTDSETGVAPVCAAHADPLPPGGTFNCTANGVAVAGQYVNKGSVSAKPVNPFAQALTIPVADEDLSHYFGYTATIDVEKSTNGQDADSPPGPTIAVGKPVNWLYKVTNTSNVTVKAIAVTDDKGVVVTCPKTELAPGESMDCTAQGVAVEGPYKNIGTAMGQPVDGSGQPLGQPVTDADPSHYTGTTECVPPPSSRTKYITKPRDYILYKGRKYNVLPQFDKQYVIVDGKRHYVRVRKDGKRVVTIDGVDYIVVKRAVDRRLARGCPPAPVKPDDKPKDDQQVSPSPIGSGEESSASGDSPGSGSQQPAGGQPQGPAGVSSGTNGGKAGAKVTCVGTVRYWLGGPGKASKVWRRLGSKGGQTRFFASKRTYRQMLEVAPDRPYLVLARAYVMAKLNALGGAALPEGVAESMAWAEQYFPEAGEVEYPRKEVLQHARVLRKRILPLCTP